MFWVGVAVAGGAVARVFDGELREIGGALPGAFGVVAAVAERGVILLMTQDEASSTI